MPNLTAPFVSQSGETIVAPALPTALEYPGHQVSTELALTPRTNEVWKIEGVTMKASASYRLASYVNVKNAYESALSQRNYLVKVEEFRQKLYETTPTNEAAAALEESHAALSAAKTERESLGMREAREGLTSPMIWLVRLYLRGGELVYASELVPLRLSSGIETYRQEGTTTSIGNFSEYLEAHYQFDDPITIGERESLRMTLQLVGPGPVSLSGIAKEGREVKGDVGITFGALEATASYTREG
jgi:hypothetical protein